MPHKEKRLSRVHFLYRFLKGGDVLDKIFPAVASGNKAQLLLALGGFAVTQIVIPAADISFFGKSREYVSVPPYIFAHTVHKVEYPLYFAVGNIYDSFKRVNIVGA